jgi:hypothetical protein
MDQYTTAELLGRIDERTKNTAVAVTALDIKVDGFGERLGRVESTLESLSPVKRIIYGAIAVILTTLLIAVLTLILTRPPQTQPASVPHIDAIK